MRLLIGLFILLIPSLAVADDAICDFPVHFPSAPYIEEKCEDGQCFEIKSYTKVFDMATTIQIRAICSPIDADILKKYDGDVMQRTLKAMTDKAVIQSFDTSYREEEYYRHASLIGEGLMGDSSSLYIAQLWISERSSLSIEAEMIGVQNDAADQVFSDILGSIRYFPQ